MSASVVFYGGGSEYAVIYKGYHSQTCLLTFIQIQYLVEFINVYGSTLIFCPQHEIEASSRAPSTK